MDENEQLTVAIDPDNLDKECIRLPTDYLKYAHRAAEARRDVEEFKCELDVVESELMAKVRMNPNNYGMEKPTDKGITAAVIALPKYTAALDKLNTAKHKADITQAVVWAIEAKKKCLSMMVELHGLGYFANVKVSRAGKEVIEDMTQNKSRRGKKWEDE